MKIFKGFQKGVNLGGWISQFAEYDTEHFETFITEKDIEYIASLGFDHVRVPVDYNVLEDEEGTPIESGFGYLKNCLSWCQKYDLHMLIDLHECFGYSFDPLKVDMDRKKFFYDEALQARFMKLWAKIAETFKDYPETVAFEPLNEVTLYEVKDAWNEIVRRYIEMIRSIAPDTYIVIGGVVYNHVTSVPLLDPPYDDKVVYNFHCYEPFLFTHQAAYWVDYMPADFRIDYPLPIDEYRKISVEQFGMNDGVTFDERVTKFGPEFFELIFTDAIKTAEKYDAALYCGEYGAIDLANNAGKLRWLQDIHKAFEKYGIGHALWNYKEKDFGLVDERFKEIKDEFIKIV
ncbi:MAG: glycoside hydrolase family 5 protein [Lachnospiraceae bacterium]|nr:glycoside hydrolase family 5 protein [Lachnospiraceae bacterium]